MIIVTRQYVACKNHVTNLYAITKHIFVLHCGISKIFGINNYHDRAIYPRQKTYRKLKGHADSSHFNFVKSCLYPAHNYVSCIVGFPNYVARPFGPRKNHFTSCNDQGTHKLYVNKIKTSLYHIHARGFLQNKCNFDLDLTVLLYSIFGLCYIPVRGLSAKKNVTLT